MQPVDAIVRYSNARPRGAGETATEAALEGEYLRGTDRRSSGSVGAQQTLHGALVTASRAVSAYKDVASATSPANQLQAQRLDLRV